ncbi:hypothetical protein ABIA00_002455 [Bradyrhizobium ottawaense]|uniref:Phage baseplate upper protein n=1 Tax=Bradyrhizobium barranii subsp. barranii TaxID=2823807 RepID=A0A7Z0QH01_9BRAD|nr:MULTISPECIES: hypothetical protein [Bradyrhizobium]UGX90324.1 phage baseplate upper protein [Bradyrhizobium barranii subsp. barranii]UQE01173.1 hypothetical protein JEY30_14095 [Bradyrhizobium japonicum]
MAIVNITCENDADFCRQFAYQLTDGTPIDLTGSTMKMGIRRHAADVAEEMLLTTENGGLTITDAVNGKFTVLIKQSQLVLLDLGEYEHSLIRIAGTQRMRVWSGSLVNNPGASR